MNAMNVLSAEMHRNAKVVLGHYRSFRGEPLSWEAMGFGCIVHPRLVVTSYSVLRNTESTYRGDRTETVARLGDSELVCKCLYRDEVRNLAVLTLERAVTALEGWSTTKFPKLADQLPLLGQPLGFVVDHDLRGTGRATYYQQQVYQCCEVGLVSLLLAADAVLYGLRLDLRRGTCVEGLAVFGADGEIFGIANEFLTNDVLHSQAESTSQGFLVFSPIASIAKETTQIALQY